MSLVLATTSALILSSPAFAGPAQLELDSYREELAPVGGAEVTHFLAQTTGLDPHEYGLQVPVLGDVDGDGVDDFAILSRNESTPSERVELYSGATGALIRTLKSYGGVEGWVSRVGDVDGDGLADVAVVVSQQKTRIYSGADGSTILDIPLEGAPAPAGDVNADGTPDLLIREWAGDDTRVVSGADASVIHTLAGGGAVAWFVTQGEMTAPLGDLDGDGYDDLIVGAYWEGASRRGVVRVYSGRDASVLFRYDGNGDDAEFGFAVAGLPDWDGDGVDDFAFHGHVPASADPHRPPFVRACSGATGVTLFELRGRFNDAFGAALASVPDADGDGVDDLLVGAPSRWARNGRANHYWEGFQGAAFLYSGATLDLLHRFDGIDDEPYSRTGAIVHGMGDVDGDGLGNFVIVSYGVTPNLFFDGSVVRVMGLDPHMILSDREISAAAGGTLDLALDFPADAANQPYKILMSGRLDGRTELGVLVPLARDPLFERTLAGQYPFPGAGAMQGTLDANGDRAFTLTVAPGALNAAVGRTYALAAIVQPAGQDATHASIQRTLTILP